MPAVTLEDLESLATKLEEDESARKLKLQRLIRVYSRIIAIRDPRQFKKMPLEFSDKDDHYDNSFPPDQEYKDHRGPRAIEIVSETTTEIATSGGFYYDFKKVTTDRGVYVGADGTLLGCEITGTGELGQFAAHPGNTNVKCEIEWPALSLEDVPVERLDRAEGKLRELAFPLVAALQNA